MIQSPSAGCCWVEAFAGADAFDAGVQWLVQSCMRATRVMGKAEDLSNVSMCQRLQCCSC